MSSGKNVYAPILMPHWLHPTHPMAAAAISEVLATEFERLMARDGVYAFEMPRTSALAHGRDTPSSKRSSARASSRWKFILAGSCASSASPRVGAAS